MKFHLVDAGVLCAAAMLSTAGRLLSEKMDVLQLTFYTAPVSCVMLFPFYLIREVRLIISESCFQHLDIYYRD